MTQPKVLTRVEDRVLHITINRPERRNAIDPETNRLMHEALERFAADDDLWIAVLRGASKKAFSAGGNLKAIDASLSDGEAYAIPATGYGGLTSRFDLYDGTMDIEVEMLRWYEAFACWRNAVLIQQLYDRYMRGESQNPALAQAGAEVSRFAARAEAVLDMSFQ